MNRKNYNEEIEILDGLDEFIDGVSQQESVTVEEPFKMEEEEVLSVLDDKTEELESDFTEFVPNTLEEVMESEVEQEEHPMNVEVELEPIEPVKMVELDEMDDSLIEKIPEEESDKTNDEIFQAEENSVVFTPMVEDFPEIEIEPVVTEPDEPKVSEIERNATIGPDFLEPVEIIPTAVEEDIQTPEEVTLTETQDMTEAALGEVRESALPEEKVEDSVPDYTIDYDFVHGLTNNNESTIDDAFQFEPNVEPMTEPTLETTDDTEIALGKTVIIEPVEPKKVEEEKKESSDEASLEDLNLPVVEETKVVPVKESKNKKKKEKKNSVRVTLFVILLIILLLSFAVLVPMILENFAL